MNKTKEKLLKNGNFKIGKDGNIYYDANYFNAEEWDIDKCFTQSYFCITREILNITEAKKDYRITEITKSLKRIFSKLLKIREEKPKHFFNSAIRYFFRAFDNLISEISLDDITNENINLLLSVLQEMVENLYEEYDYYQYNI